MSAAKFTSALLTAPGPHPDVDLLRRYAAGTLPPAEQQPIEAHTLDCERCDDLVAGFAMGTPASTDQAVAELRTRLQARLQQPELRPVGRPLWQPLAAAATIAGLLAGGLWGWQHNAPSTQPDLARTTVVAPATPPAPPATAAPAEMAAAPAEPATEPAANATPATEVAAAPPAVAAPGRAARPAARPTPPAAAAADTDVAVVLTPVTSSAASAEAAPDFALNDELTAKQEEAKDDKAAAPSVAASRASMKAKTAAPAAEGSVRRPEPMPPVPALPAQPLGGMKTLKEYLRRAATEFEPEINTTRLTGMVHIKATVGEDGRLHNVKVTRGLRDDYDAEAERIVCDGPTWTPAVSAGRRVPTTVEISVPF
ncbi:energy transducer TonB [Hymenobacter sp. ASUV-10]|uniref:Energy transducer TonB n=1 Tax=Hymenobacter aranciens TaxID=3063996 RepID=A0ABT9BA67_9BACT|nr:energy transducer TonB [Hymenobacter sp. ASUV-10]MDO7875159.1 energy transducer TonB [Hymenobacter sp. ASUV-10]